MRYKQLFALVLVGTLIGSAMAAHEAHESELGEAMGAPDVQVVQQHAVFVELIAEDVEDDREEDITNLGVVAGLVKECEEPRGGAFDNAVLWFNDQFLFGSKTDIDEREKMGMNPDRTHDSVDGGDGFVDKNRNADGDIVERWGGCWVPNGFAHAFQSDGNDPETVRAAIDEDNVEISGCEELISLDSADVPPDAKDQVCEVDEEAGQPMNDSPFRGGTQPGSVCDAEATHSYYVTDPNGFQWVIDVSEDCDGIEGPLYTAHLQIDPTTNLGIADRADWSYSDGTQRLGVPYMENSTDSELWDDCKAGGATFDKCSIEYSFLIAANLDDHDPTRSADDDEAPTHCPEGERFDDQNWALHGESHPHSPEEDACGDTHTHPSLDIDIMFHDKAPFWIEESPYWDNAHSDDTTAGTPPEVTFPSGPGNWDACVPQSINAESDYQEAAIQDRTFQHPCDSVQDRGFHAHDGSQTTYPS